MGRMEKFPERYNVLFQLPTGGGKTVIFSSHIMSEVDLLCDDLAIINKGKLLYSGTMEDFRSNMQTDTLTGEFIRIVNEN